MAFNRKHYAQHRTIWPPEAGTLFAFRLVKDGWRVPGRIICDDEGRWHAEIDGTAYPAHADPALAPMVDALWHGGIKIPQADFDWLIEIREFARKYDPDHPSLHPRDPISPRSLRPMETP